MLTYELTRFKRRGLSKIWAVNQHRYLPANSVKISS